MTDTEARALCAEAQRGNVEAAQRVTEAHIRLAQLVASDWARVYKGASKSHAISEEDLEQTALVILMEEVIPHYRAEGLVPFRSFARKKMNAGLWRGLKSEVRQHDLVERATPFLHSLLEASMERQNPEEAYFHSRVPAFVYRAIDSAQTDGRLTSDQADVMRLAVRGESGTAIAEATGIFRHRVYVLISGAREVLKGDFFDDYE